MTPEQIWEMAVLFCRWRQTSTRHSSHAVSRNGAKDSVCVQAEMKRVTKQPKIQEFSPSLLPLESNDDSETSIIKTKRTLRLEDEAL